MTTQFAALLLLAQYVTVNTEAEQAADRFFAALDRMAPMEVIERHETRWLDLKDDRADARDALYGWDDGR